MSIGQRIKIARRLRSMTQKDLQAASGVSQQMISALESGTAKKTTGIVELASALGVRYRWLATGELPMVEGIPPSADDQNAILAAVLALPALERSEVVAKILRAVAEQFEAKEPDE